MIILIDNGHGQNTQGKQSPLLKGSGLSISSEFTENGRFKEWKYTRTIAKQVVDNYVKYLSEGLLNYCNILRPNIIVLSGGVANEGENLISRVREYMRKFDFGMHNMPEPIIAKSTMGYDSGKIGAAALYF